MPKQTLTEGEALILIKAARIVHESSNPKDSILMAHSPPIASKNHWLRGADLINRDSADSQACLFVSQTILFNCKKTRKSDSAAKI